MKLLKLTPSGEITVIETSRAKLLDTCHREIGCTCIEMPGCMKLPWPYQMIVDESGLLKEDPVVNMTAWWCYSRGALEAPIVGTVLFGRLGRVGKYQEEDIVSLTDEDIEVLTDYLTQIGKTIANIACGRT